MRYEIFLILSIIFFVLAIFMLIFYILKTQDSKAEVGFIGIIGFIPIVFGTSKKAILIALIFFIIFFIIFFLIWLIFNFFK